MHLYQTFKQKNARNMLRMLSLFPTVERDLIVEFLGKVKECEGVYEPFMHQLTDALVSKGFEVDSTGDVGVAMLMAFMHPRMRKFYGWAFKTYQDGMLNMQSSFSGSTLFGPTEEEVAEMQDQMRELALTVTRKFYHTLGLIFGVEFILSNADMAEVAANQKGLDVWIKEFIPRAAQALGYDIDTRRFGG